MAIETMYDFLTDVTPDYTTTNFEVDPQEVMNISGEKNIEIHPSRGRAEEIIILSDESKFRVKLVWKYLSHTDHATIFSFYHDPAKGCGIGRTFYWVPPAQYDSHVYVVRFDCKWESFLQNYQAFGIAGLILYVVGRKTEAE